MDNTTCTGVGSVVALSYHQQCGGYHAPNACPLYQFMGVIPGQPQAVGVNERIAAALERIAAALEKP